MAQYTWELHWDGVIVDAGGSPAPPADATWDQANPLGIIVMGFAFHDHSGSPVGLSMQLELWAHSFGGGPTYELRAVQRDLSNTGLADFNTAVPIAGAFVHIAPDGGNGSLFTQGAGGSFVVTLDDLAQTITCQGPVTTTSYSFAAVGLAAGTVSLANLDFFGMMSHPPTAAQDWRQSDEFFNFYLSLNGDRILGAQLGAGQGGVWSAAPFVVGAIGVPVGTAGTIHPQTQTRQVGSISYNHTLNTDGLVTLLAVWNPATTTLQEVDALIDLLQCVRSPFLLYARVTKQNVDAVTVGYSDNQGHTWTEILVGQKAGSFCESPSLSETSLGQPSLTFYDGDTVQNWIGIAGARLWSFRGDFFPLTLSSATTHPRHFIHPAGTYVLTWNSGGHLFTASYDAFNNLFLNSTDLGNTAGGLDVYPTIYATPLGRVFIEWAASATSFAFYSDTIGNSPFVSLTPVISFADLRPSIRYKVHEGVAWVLFQRASDLDIRAYSADNPSLNANTPIGAVTIAPAAAAQYAAIDVLPLGLPLAVYQTYSAGPDRWSVVTKKLADGIALWSNA